MSLIKISKSIKFLAFSRIGPNSSKSAKFISNKVLWLFSEEMEKRPKKINDLIEFERMKSISNLSNLKVIKLMCSGADQGFFLSMSQFSKGIPKFPDFQKFPENISDFKTDLIT